MVTGCKNDYGAACAESAGNFGGQPIEQVIVFAVKVDGMRAIFALLLWGCVEARRTH
jgi:hypothetical protein